MKAVYALDTLCVVVKHDPHGVLLEPMLGSHHNRFWIPFDSEDLILNPTDDEVEDLQP